MKIKVMILAGIVFSGLAYSANAAEINKWVDDTGKVHYGASPPAQAKATEIRAPAPAGEGVEFKPRSNVVLYSTSWCKFCRKARKFLNEQGIAFTEKDIDKDRSAKQTYKRLGGRGVPFLVRNGQDKLYGFSRNRYLEFFSEN